MALTNLTHSAAQQEAFDPFAMQLALSTVHARLVPMRRGEQGYELDACASSWFELPAGRGFAGYGLGRALRMLLDVLRGLTALHDTFDATGETFAHGDVGLSQLRVDPDGVCRLVPLTARHSLSVSDAPAQEALWHLAPERLLGEAVDVRSDVFSAGALLWEALAGRRLFDETTRDAIIQRLMGEKLQMPQLPPELAWAIPLKAVAARALSVDPYLRFSDCAELATAIAIVARERVASHAEVARFFGAPLPPLGRRTLDSIHPGPDESALSALFMPASGPRTQVGEGSVVGQLPSQRPVPTRSATFPTVREPSSRRTSTLAPLGPARSLTPPPSVRSTPPPSSGPVSRSAPHISPFSTLLSAESRPELAPQSRPPSDEPASSGRRSTTLMSSGVSASVLDTPLAVASERTAVARSSSRPPPMPVWTQVPNVPAQLTNPNAATPLVDIAPPLPIADIGPEEGAAFRSWPARHAWGIALSLVIAAAVAALVFAKAHGRLEPAAKEPTVAAATTEALAAGPVVVPVPEAPADPAVPAPSDLTAPGEVAPSAPSASGPAPKAPAKAIKHTKDYGI
jgi:serine/threonine-protein kinase